MDIHDNDIKITNSLRKWHSNKWMIFPRICQEAQEGTSQVHQVL